LQYLPKKLNTFTLTFRKPFDWILQARALHNLQKNMLSYGPAQVTLGNLLTLVPPNRLKKRDVYEIKKQLPKFVPGWLSDMVLYSIFDFWQTQFLLKGENSQYYYV
jgi:hypothetical protein